MRTSIAAVLTLGLMVCACGDDSSTDPDAGAVGSDSSGDGNATTEATPATTEATPGTTTDEPATDDGNGSGDETAGSDTGTDQGPPPPTNEAELIPWLEAGHYLKWTGESGIHDSSGPHFGGVRTYVNDILFDSLQSGAMEHPMGSVAVKELYGSGDTIGGWSVTFKVQDASAGGDGWYWYEGFEGSTYADGTGKGLCTGCHISGQDFFRSPFPLQ